MSVRLATVEGTLVTPVFIGPRFTSEAGAITDRVNPLYDVPLSEACEAHGLFQERALSEPNARVAALYWSDAAELFEAIAACRAQRRALGWQRPEDADYPTKEQA